MGRHGTIAGRKAAQDAKRAANFTKYARVITIAAKAGGDPDYNVALKHAIDRAKGINMPNDKIQKAIKKGTGELDGELLVEGSFEGYGAGGVAVIVDVLTDNNNRTTAFVKHAFDKYNGNLGKPGCVSYMFDQKGQIIIDREECDMDADDLMMMALDAGAEDFSEEEDSFEILTNPDDFSAVREALEKEGVPMAEAEITMIPQNYVSLSDENDIKYLNRTLDLLDEDDDVQAVYHNWDE